MNKEVKNADIVRRKWDKTFEVKVERRPLQFAWQNRTMNKFLTENYLDGASVGVYLKRFLGGKTIKKGLEVGGGLGKQAIIFYHLLNTEKFDVIDISNFAVEAGNKRAKEENINVEFMVSDLNNDSLPENTYDLIIASGALHHIGNLEHLFEQISRSLTSDGVFFASDYMGPNHMQWTEQQLGIMNAILALFPDQYAKVLHRNDEVIKEISRIPLSIFYEHDPSEGIRSADIFDVMAEYLNIVKITPICYTILYELLRGRIHNFDEFDEKDQFILNLLCILEKTLFDNQVIGSDFNLVIAKRKS